MKALVSITVTLLDDEEHKSSFTFSSEKVLECETHIMHDISDNSFVEMLTIDLGKIAYREPEYIKRYIRDTLNKEDEK